MRELWPVVMVVTAAADILLRCCAGVSLEHLPKTPQKNNHQNISNLLDNLLFGYDNSIRPDFGGPPAVVEVDIMVRSMGPISEVDMTYSMDCYFRQSWVDRRLAFPGDTIDTLALSISMLARIWKPDTYFYNGKHSYLHTITTPNKFVRLFQDGRVLYSSRLTIKAGCPMNLEDFPMDIQRCPLKFGSFGYTSRDVLYRWNKDRQVAIADDMKLSQFDLIATPAANHTDFVPNGGAKSAEYSMLLVSFHLQRHMGNFLIQVYGPCVLLVVLSWVSFWLNREATADRVSLGITTVLTMTFLGLEARTDLPKVPYPTALDFFVFLSFAFIFATIIQIYYRCGHNIQCRREFLNYAFSVLIFSITLYLYAAGMDGADDYLFGSEEYDAKNISTEWHLLIKKCKFAVVHYFTKYGSGECYFSSDFNSDSSSDEEEWTTIETKESSSKGTPVHASTSGLRKTSQHLERLRDPNYIEVIPLSPVTIPMRPASYSWTRHLNCYKRSKEARVNVPPTPVKLPSPAQSRMPSLNRRPRKKKKKRTPRFNSVSKIDRASRVVFPALFLAINVFYWYLYLSRTQRIKNLSSVA